MYNPLTNFSSTGLPNFDLQEKEHDKKVEYLMGIYFSLNTRAEVEAEIAEYHRSRKAAVAAVVAGPSISSQLTPNVSRQASPVPFVSESSCDHVRCWKHGHQFKRFAADPGQANCYFVRVDDPKVKDGQRFPLTKELKQALQPAQLPWPKCPWAYKFAFVKAKCYSYSLHDLMKTRGFRIQFSQADDCYYITSFDSTGIAKPDEASEDEDELGL